MLKANALIILVNSLTKPEKKSFNTNSRNSDYLDLFNLIEKNKNISKDELKHQFSIKRPKANFDITVNYLYKLLLDTLLSLREQNDHHYLLMNKILKARILFEKSLFEESLDILSQVKELAIKHENYIAYLYSARLELEYLLFLNFPNISETDLLNKHFRINENLKFIRKINEQSSLYELLKHRIINKGNIRSERERDSLNNLVMSEMSIISSLKGDNFEIKKLHQLFQSNYLISVGDYKSALHSYYELNNLFEENKHLKANPPSYYLTVIEGILDSLRSIKSYESMPYFIDQLKKINHPTISFQMEVSCIVFLYTLLPHLDNGDFSGSKAILLENQENLLNKIHLLSPARQAEINLYSALAFLGVKDFKLARKSLRNMIYNKSFSLLPLFRTVRLINLIIYYEMNELESMEHEIRSIKRELSKLDKAYKTEQIMLKFLNKDKSNLLLNGKEKIWQKLEPELNMLKKNVYERQILKLFDFTAWIESKLTRRTLSEILKETNR